MSPRSVSIRPYFARRPRPGDPRPRQPLAKIDGKRPAQVRPPASTRAMRLPFEDALKAADGGLDFGKPAACGAIWRRRHKPARGAAR